MLSKKEEAWKKIQLRALENPVKDQLKGYEISYFVEITNVHNEMRELSIEDTQAKVKTAVFSQNLFFDQNCDF